MFFDDLYINIYLLYAFYLLTFTYILSFVIFHSKSV
jgi:hypothetical protein